MTAAMASVAIFDMNETTLDLAPVRATVDEVLGRAGGFGSCFGRLLQTSLAVTATGDYEDFTAVADFGALAAALGPAR